MLSIFLPINSTNNSILDMSSKKIKWLLQYFLDSSKVRQLWKNCFVNRFAYSWGKKPKLPMVTEGQKPLDLYSILQNICPYYWVLTFFSILETYKMSVIGKFSRMAFMRLYHKTGHFCSKVARFMIIYREGKISILRSNWVSDIVLWVKNKPFWLKKNMSEDKKWIYAPSGFNFAVQNLSKS